MQKIRKIICIDLTSCLAHLQTTVTIRKKIRKTLEYPFFIKLGKPYFGIFLGPFNKKIPQNKTF